MPGQAISHYTVLGKLAEGRRGIVYKARDPGLDPFVVALKREKDETSGTSTLTRPEAKAASALNYPNIVTIYVGSADRPHGADAKLSYSLHLVDRQLPVELTPR